MKKIIPGLLILVGVLLAVYFVPAKKVTAPHVYSSPKLGFSFTYPDDYFLAYETSATGERDQHALVLVADTAENRAFFANPPEGTEAPPTITISLFQNNLDGYTATSFVEGASASNFKLSDGKTTEVVVGGRPGLRYRATGLYESENVVVAQPNFVYLFTVQMNGVDAETVAAFDSILKTVVFDGGATGVTPAAGQ